MRRIAPRPPPGIVVPTSSEQEKCGGDNSANDREIKRRKKRSASRVLYSLEDKEKILLLIENGWKTCDIQRIVGAPESTIRNFRKKKGLLKKSVQSAKEQLALGGGTASTPVLVNKLSDRQRLISETEQLLLPWALDYLKEKGTLESSIVRKQALLFFQALSFNRGINVSPPFTASGSWLARFRKRFGLEEEEGRSVGTKGKEPPATPTESSAPNTVFHNIEEEPPSPPGEDPLAIRPEEEEILRNAGGSEVTTPQAVIPLDDQSLSSPSDIAGHKVWVIDEEYGPQSNDSGDSQNVNPLDIDNDDKPEDEDEIFKIETTEEEECREMSTEAPPPPPPPPQIETIALDTSPGTPNSSSSSHKITHSHPPPKTSTSSRTKSSKHRAPRTLNVQVIKDSTAIMPCPSKEKTSTSQPPPVSDKGNAMHVNAPSLTSLIQASREGTSAPHVPSSKKKKSTQNKGLTPHAHLNVNTTTLTPKQIHSNHDRTLTPHTHPSVITTTLAPQHTHSTPDITLTLQTHANVKTTSPALLTHSAQNRSSTHRTDTSENSICTGHHIHSTHNKTSTHLTPPNNKRTPPPHHAPSTLKRTITQFTQPTENRICTGRSKHSTHKKTKTSMHHHKPLNVNRISPLQHTPTTHNKTTTQHTQPTENSICTGRSTHTTHNKTSTHSTPPSNKMPFPTQHTPTTHKKTTTQHTQAIVNMVSTGGSTHPTYNTASTQLTSSLRVPQASIPMCIISTPLAPPLLVPQTAIPMCILYGNQNQQQQPRPPTSQPPRTVEATQRGGAAGSELSRVPSSGQQQQKALCPALPKKRTKEINVHKRLAEVTLGNEMLRQEILKESLLQKKLETAVQRQRALQSGVEVRQPSDDPSKPGDDPNKSSDEPSKPSDEPSKPSGDPSEPSDEPSKPSDEPSKPGVEPGKPGDDLSKPGDDPNKSSDEPSKLSDETSKPSDDRNKSNDEPSKPSNEPSKPSDDLSKPSDNPFRPNDDPCKLSDDPSKASDEPSMLIDEPSKPSDEPSKSSDESSKPSDEPSKSSDEPNKPYGGLVQPGGAANQPHNGRAPKRSKKVKRLLKKVKLLDKCKEGMSIGAVGKFFNTSPNTVRYAKKHEAKIREFVSASIIPPATKPVVNTRPSAVSQMEDAIYVWIHDQNMKGNYIDETAIWAKANYLYEKMATVPEAAGPDAPSPAPATHPEFRASKRWLMSFQRRFSLHNIKIAKHSALGNRTAAAAFRRQLENIIKEKGYRPEQVWNMDETVLYWKRMPARTQLSKDGRAPRERCALLLCANAAGHLIKPGFVYTSTNPASLKQKKRSLLPVHLMTPSHGSPISSIVMDWARHCLLPEVQAYLWGKGLPWKFLLILDNALGHHKALEGLLEGVEVVFLPQNTFSLIQPLEQGIAAAFKACYFQRSMQRLQEAVDLEPTLSVRDYWRGFTIADCLVLVQEAMKDLHPQAVNDCWSVLWPECVQNSEELTPQDLVAEALRKTVELARLVGGEGFGDMEQSEVREMLEEHSAPLTDEELLVMVQPSQEEAEEDSDGPPQQPTLTLDKLRETMRLAAQLSKYLCDMDPSMVRGLRVVDSINQAVAPYKKMFEDLRRKQRQAHKGLRVVSATPAHTLTFHKPECVVVEEQPTPISASQPDHENSSSSPPAQFTSVLIHEK